MSLIEELADEHCKRLTSREGCLGKGGYPKEQQCAPCRARAELGRPAEAPRTCDRCGRKLTGVNLADDVMGVDEDGSATCPAPRHSPIRFSDEFVG